MNETEHGEVRYELGQHAATLHNMDCITGMEQKLDRGSVDVVVTSPPYNLGIEYGTYDDTLSRRDYLDWIGRWARVINEVLADKGSLFLNIGSKPSDPWVPFDVLQELRDVFLLQNVIHWVKAIAIQREDAGDYPGMTGNVAVGHYKPINSGRFLNDCHEYVFHLTKNGNVELDRLAIGVEYQDKSNVTRWEGAKAGKRCRGNTWFVPYRTIRSRDDQRPHPATFPVKLPKMCILLHGLERTRLVLDPFMGIGHSAVACAELGVDFAGFEIDPNYYAESCRAVEQATGRDAQETGRQGSPGE